MAETMYRFKITKTQPRVQVQKEAVEYVYESFTLQALDAFLFAKHAHAIVQSLIRKKTVQFIMHKANISAQDIQEFPITREELAQKAYQITSELDGKFVTSMDLFIAYLFLTEPKTTMLFKKHVKFEDMLHILYWARFDHPQEENPPLTRVLFWGEGVGEGFTTGWTVETSKYTVDITNKVLNEKPVLLGRREEFNQMVNMLSKPTQNNVLLIGEVGTGKTSLVDALALNSFLGVIPGRKLYHKRVYQLMIGQLVAGVQHLGDLESRIQSILEELSHAGNVLLFIPDLEQIVGGSTFRIDLSGALLPSLRDSKLPVIATTTPGAYKKFLQPLQVFSDLFDIVKVEEPSRVEAIQMLLERANDLEEKNHIFLTYKAIVSAVDLAKRFMQERSLPGSAITLLSSVASAASLAHKQVVDESDVTTKIEQQTQGAIAAPGEKETALLLNFEENLHKRIIGQDEAVTAISQAVRRVRAGLAAPTRPISFLFLGPTGVGKSETAKALASVYFGGEEKTIRLDMSEYTSSGSINRLLGATAGQGDEKGELTEKVAEHPFSLVMLDEFEKAHPEVLDLFLQVFEDGRLTDNHGKLVSFANTVIIATSNAGALYIKEQLKQGKAIDAAFQQGLLEEIEKDHIFKPELLNRFDGIIVFRPLTQENTQKIAALYLQSVQNKLELQDIHVQFTDSVVTLCAKRGFDPEFGARPLRRFIQDTIEDLIAKAILEGKISRGAVLHLSADAAGTLQFSQQTNA
jgi:ATP-dependent Clp protease ATP-binding subunit ClpC